ncbi:hypothetical protein [Streptomyces sp. NPDC090445]|uniref:hypothetical protein n=1 Tax=Streptomyces sp. NPDC090445 TaxID=3365963 RepID=UPI00380B75A7
MNRNAEARNTAFACGGCGAALSARLSRAALPLHARQTWGHGLLPVLMQQGTYAVDPDPWGPPWRRWHEIGEDEAAARGVFAPQPSLSFGSAGTIVVAPGDTRGTALIPGRHGGTCCGLDGSDGPNLACAHCGLAVATRIDDCSLWQEVRFDPAAVRAVPADEGDGDDAGRHGPDLWEGAVPTKDPAPPVDPSGDWNPQWAAAVAAALAHLLAVSEGLPVALPEGPVAALFAPALDALTPPGNPVLTAAPAGPGLPEPAADILLVPRHPRTGTAWQPSDATAVTVPLAADVWTHLALPTRRRLVPAPGTLPEGILRDDPLPDHPWQSFRPDWGVFVRTLARLPAVRGPRLRGIHDRVRERPYAHPF